MSHEVAEREIDQLVGGQIDDWRQGRRHASVNVVGKSAGDSCGTCNQATLAFGGNVGLNGLGIPLGSLRRTYLPSTCRGGVSLVCVDGPFITAFKIVGEQRAGIRVIINDLYLLRSLA